METESAQQELISEFGLFDDWIGRYEYIIDLGKPLLDFPERWKNEKYKIQGCQSQVWIRAEMHNGKLHFDGTSDAAIVRGLIAVLFRVYNDRSPDEILKTRPDFIADIGFAQHLSPTRSNGLHAMLGAVYAQAQEHASASGSDRTRETE